MPLAWPRAYVLVHTLSDVPHHSAALLLLLLLATGTVVGDHHHHHRSNHYGIAQSFAQALTGGQGPDAEGNFYQDSPISRLNPWLSACDLAHPATAPDLQGPCATIMSRGPGTGHAHPIRVNGDIAEGPGPPRSLPGTPPGPVSEEKCPKSCSAHNASHTQCLRYLHESDKEKLCSSMSEARLAEFRLRHCCEHSVANSLTPEALKAVLSSSTQCLHYLGTLLDLDALAARLSCEFGEILSRFDCDHLYSVKYRCTHCQESYRRWVCSSLVPHFPRPGGPRVRPCRSVCRSVEQKCPFFLPGDRAPSYPTQYAGEPTFLCVDPNIPESGIQRANSLYDEDECCYKHCDERGLPYLCLSNSSCAQRPAEDTPQPVICDPPPPWDWILAKVCYLLFLMLEKFKVRIVISIGHSSLWYESKTLGLMAPRGFVKTLNVTVSNGVCETDIFIMFIWHHPKSAHVVPTAVSVRRVEAMPVNVPKVCVSKSKPPRVAVNQLRKIKQFSDL
ncbi:uncharacterized protein LOC117643988 [Thrips palmi]|uniref:Uncharacterized protein LOC117643988 n=1 Tax=Thrips palmi TaxID=161013 RepID=A0A6P8YQ59_THRPL|nr:uncharacterized protein LOC117643988 [Thrips palmi]